MYLLAQATAIVECPRHVAFHYTADLDNFAEWFPGVVRMTAANDLPFDRVGKRYRETVDLPWRGRREVQMCVVDVATPSRLATEGELPAILPRMEIGFRELGPQRCEIGWRMYSRTTSGLVRLAVLPLARRLMAGRALTGMQRLKDRLEARPRSSR